MHKGFCLYAQDETRVKDNNGSYFVMRESE